MRRSELAVLARFCPLTLLLPLALACDRRAAGPTAPPLAITALAPATDAAVAAPEVTNTTLALDFIRSNECDDEQVALSGDIHLLTVVQPDGSVVGHLNYQGVSGVGLTSGRVYRAASAGQFRLAAPFPSSIQSVGVIRLVSAGAASDLLVRTLFHVTVTATGEVTATIDELTSACIPSGGP